MIQLNHNEGHSLLLYISPQHENTIVLFSSSIYHRFLMIDGYIDGDECSFHYFDSISDVFLNGTQ